MNKPFLRTGYLGLFVIAMSVVLLFVFPSKAPSLPDGFLTPVIAFEFAQTKGDVMRIFGGDNEPLRKEMVDGMDFGNRLDFLYMCLYAGFLMMLSAKCAAISQNKYFYSGAMISFAVLVGDALENVQLLGITSNIASGNIDGPLRLLHLFTWIKWGGIAVIFLILSPWFLKGGRFSKIIGITGLISFALGVASFFHRSVVNEIFSLSVALMFTLMIIYCFSYRADAHV